MESLKVNVVALEAQEQSGEIGDRYQVRQQSVELVTCAGRSASGECAQGYVPRVHTMGRSGGCTRHPPSNNNPPLVSTKDADLLKPTEKILHPLLTYGGLVPGLQCCSHQRPVRLHRRAAVGCPSSSTARSAALSAPTRVLIGMVTSKYSYSSGACAIRTTSPRQLGSRRWRAWRPRHLFQVWMYAGPVGDQDFEYVVRQFGRQLVGKR